MLTWLVLPQLGLGGACIAGVAWLFGCPLVCALLGKRLNRGPVLFGWLPLTQAIALGLAFGSGALLLYFGRRAGAK